MAKNSKKPTTGSSAKTRAVKSWKARAVQNLTSAIAFLERLNEELGRGGVEVEDTQSSLVYVKGALTIVEGLDNDWKPPSKSKRRNGALEVGGAVTLKEDCTANYSFIPKLSAQMVGAKVHAEFDRQSVVVQLADGSRMMFQKRHLARA